MERRLLQFKLFNKDKQVVFNGILNTKIRKYLVIEKKLKY